MSYVRMSEHGTDVYVWGSTPDTIDVQVRWSNFDANDERLPFKNKHVGESHFGLTREDAFRTLRRLNRDGVRVPRKVFRRLRREIKTGAL